jgi:medium-chain acyl-[acyl-carrier-protein] hydrolase
MTLDPHTNRWLSCTRSRSAARLRLVCFPHAGAGASAYWNWPKLLPPEIECCPIQLPGREQRIAERPFSSLWPLVEALAGALEPVLTPPFAFFGSSMGALVGFELARFLRAAGRPGPTWLFVAARAAPHLPDPSPPMHDLPAEAFVGAVARLNGTSPEVLAHKELMDVIVPLLRADFAVCETYRYIDQQPLECPISAFAAVRDRAVPLTAVAEWRAHTKSHFRQRVLEGGHFFVQKAAGAVIAGVVEDLFDTTKLSGERGCGRVAERYA